MRKASAVCNLDRVTGAIVLSEFHRDFWLPGIGGGSFRTPLKSLRFLKMFGQFIQYTVSQFCIHFTVHFAKMF